MEVKSEQEGKSSLMGRGEKGQKSRKWGGKETYICMVFSSIGQNKNTGVAFWNKACSDWEVNMPQVSGFLHSGKSRVNVNAYFLGFYLFFSF